MLIYYCIIIMVFVKNVRKICEEREGLSYRLIYYDRKSGGRERGGGEEEILRQVVNKWLLQNCRQILNSFSSLIRAHSL